MKKSTFREMYSPIIDKERVFDYVLEPEVIKEKKTKSTTKPKDKKVK